MNMIPENHNSNAKKPKTQKSFTEVSKRTQQRRTKQLIEGTSHNLLKKTAVKAIEMDNPGFEKILKASESLNESLISKFFYIHIQNKP